VARAKRESAHDPAVGGSLSLLAQIVGLAVESIGEAQVLHSHGKQQEAIEALNGLETRLTELQTLYQATLTLHRHR
jgi:hypothetical protein